MWSDCRCRLLMGMVARPHQRPRLYVLKSEAESFAFHILEFGGSIEAGDGQVIF